MDGKPLNWDYTGGLFLGISAIGRVMIRRPKLRVPKNLSSGYLKDSALPKMTDICHMYPPRKMCGIIIQTGAQRVEISHGSLNFPNEPKPVDTPSYIRQRQG